MRAFKKKVFEFVQEHPGSTGLDIQQSFLRETRLTKWFGEGSVIACLFGPSFGSIYVALWELEDEGMIAGQFKKLEDGKEYRRYRYSVPGILA